MPSQELASLCFLQDGVHLTWRQMSKEAVQQTATALACVEGQQHTYWNKEQVANHQGASKQACVSQLCMHHA